MSMYLTKAQIERNKEVIDQLKKNQICCACGRAWSDKVKKSPAKDCCLECFEAFDDSCIKCIVRKNPPKLPLDQVKKDNPHFTGEISFDNVQDYENPNFPQFSHLQVVYAERACASYLYSTNKNAWVLGAN